MGKARKAPAISTGSCAPTATLPYQPDGFNPTRARLMTHMHTQLNMNGSCVVLWMSRDQRAEDNHALQYAQGISTRFKVPLKVVFNLVPTFLGATVRQFGFMLKGLQEVESMLRSHHIPFHLLFGDPLDNVSEFAVAVNAMIVVTDFSPLRVPLDWVKGVSSRLDAVTAVGIPLVQVDAHNIVPCWVASNKLEYSARTIRSKIQTKLQEYLVDIGPLSSNAAGSLEGCEPIDWTGALDSLTIDRTVKEVDWIRPGYEAGWAAVRSFAADRLKVYGDQRNDPNRRVLSDLSPYFHFGQISVQAVVLHMKRLKLYPSSTDTFVEEAVVRRELADNFCFYNAHYDSLDGCPDWARTSLGLHRADRRPYVYTTDQLENARTHDPLWNAAQIQMLQEGKMHGFLRMYWAKKILEWTDSPEEALSVAIYLNDKYELDGRDPSGYVGCMWSIGGVHDQGWAERPVFGKIRYMNYEGCKRKFDVKAFEARYGGASRTVLEEDQQKRRS